MKKRFNLPHFLIGCGINMSVFVLLTAVAVGSIPERLYVAAGENMELSFSVPLTAQLEGESVNAVSVKNSKGEENENISLSSPFYVTAEEEGSVSAKLSICGIPLKTVSVDIIPDTEVIPCGNIVGVTMKTEGILVLGTGSVKTENGEREPARGKIYTGDIILRVNGKPIESKEDLQSLVADYSGGNFSITVLRRGRETVAEVLPVKAEGTGDNRLGVWVRDSTQGLGTVTCYDDRKDVFAALGHGIYDTDTSTLMNVKEGSITMAKVSGCKKGIKGEPGEIMGGLDKSIVLGEVYSNTDNGLCGKVNKTGESYFGNKAVPIGMRYDIKEGEAIILSDISGGGIKEYTVNIDSIDRYGGSSDKSMVITVTDERLLKETGGIIQGMSGSPIIQNGKIIGAVTHVFINNPTRGYGIFIENMLREMNGI